MEKKFVDGFTGYFNVKTKLKSGNRKQVLSEKNISIKRGIFKWEKNDFINREKSGKI